MTGPGTRGGAALIKCVVWDLDHTLLSGVYLESGEQPPAADPVLTRALTELAGRGILHAIASRNPPEAAAHAARATGREFAAAECGWGRKSEAVARIAADLDIGLDAVAFVDDDPYERAEVSFALPEVMVLSPEDAAEAPDWPEFRPPAVTEEGRRRGQLYLDRRRRQEAERAFGGSREDFLRRAGTRVTIAEAAAADAPRLAELAARTRQFNSGALPGPVDEGWFRSLLAEDGQEAFTVRLRDSFGDDGLVGGCVVARDPDRGWTVRLLMMSCRAMGRGVIDALLAWLVRSATRHGATRLALPCVLTGRNVPLRLALASAGFRAGGDEAAGDGAAGDGAAGDGAAGDGAAGDGAAGDGPGGQQAAGAGMGPVVFSHPLTGPLPALAGWVSAPGEPGQAG